MTSGTTSGTNTGSATEHVPVLVVGAGQAGLSVAWHLQRAGVRCVLVERHTAGHEWLSARWDNFTLVTPNWQCQLPGYPYAGDDPDGFMTRDEVYAWLRAYLDTFSPDVREGTAVTSVCERDGGGFTVTTTAGTFTADHVVVATGGYHVPVVPPVSHRLPGSVTQLHSSEYRTADQLPPGGVLVVGTGQSGTQIAEDLHLAGRQVHLAVGNAPRVARRYRGRDCVAWLHDMGVYDVPVQEHAGGLAKRENTNHYVTGRDGGRDLDLRRLASEGMSLYGRLTGGTGDVLHFAPTLRQSLDHADSVAESIKDDIDRWIAARGIDAPTESRYTPVWEPETEPADLDLAAAGITTVLWSIGFRADYRWVDVGVFDGSGRPCHRRGITSVPGLTFVGLPWLHTWGSGRFAAIARDAEFLAGHIVTDLAERTAARTATAGSVIAGTAPAGPTVTRPVVAEPLVPAPGTPLAAPALA